MGHEKKKKKDRERRKRSQSASGSPADGSESDRRHRRRHKKHKSEHKSDRKRRRQQELSPPPPPKLSRHSPSPAAPPPPPPPPKLSRRSASPPPAGQAAPSQQDSSASLSIEETNKLRAQLGLRPLDVGAPSGDRAAPAPGSSDTHAIHKRPENLSERRRTEKLRERLATRREQRAIESRVGSRRGLGDASDDDEGAAAWVTRSRQLQTDKALASKRAALLDDLDAEFGVGALVAEEAAPQPSYTAANLRGLTVQHGADGFVEGRHTVLTLQDRGVLDEEGDDVLVNVNMVDDERAKKNVAVRRQKPGYRPDDQEEWDEQGNFRPKTILSQYDEELDGEKKDSFVIGEAVSAGAGKAAAEAARQQLQLGVKKTLQSLQMPAPRIASEFYTDAEMTSFKKVKKKVRKVRRPGRALKADDLLAGAEGPDAHLGSRQAAAEEGDPVPLTDDTEVAADLSGVKLEPEGADSELERAVERSRRLRQQQEQQQQQSQQEEPAGGELRLAALAARLREEDADSDTAPQSIVLNSTAEFCRSLGDIPTYGLAGNRDADAEEMASRERQLAEERRRGEAEAAAGVWEEVSAAGAAAPADLSGGGGGGGALESEPEIGTGLAGALRLAQNKGYVDLDQSGKKGASQQVLAHLRAQNYSIEDKSGMEDDRRGRSGGNYNGPVTEFRDKSNYVPAVKLEYIDDQGRLLNSKEAFRYLSHKFHGKGSGKMKTEKREKKYQERQLMAQMSSADTPLNTLARLQERQRELSSPYVVLSGHKLLNSEAAGSQVSKN